MSKIIKFHSLPQKKETKIIELKKIHYHHEASGQTNDLFGEERQLVLIEAEKEASLIIEEAKKQAAQLVENVKNQQREWEEQKQILSNQAYEDGFQIGREEGRKKGYEEYRELIDQAKRVVDQSKSAFIAHVESAESTILRLGIASAEKILQSSLSEDEQKFVPLVKRALKEAKEFKEIQVHVNPTQYELLIHEKVELEALFPNHIQLFIYPNEDIEEYACLIESENGRIDASVSSQLVELKEKLVEILEGETDESN